MLNILSNESLFNIHCHVLAFSFPSVQVMHIVTRYLPMAPLLPPGQLVIIRELQKQSWNCHVFKYLPCKGMVCLSIDILV